MAKQKPRVFGGTGDGESADSAKRTEGTKKKTKACQVFEDEVYWASVVATLEKSTIARVLSPLIREELRKKVRSHGVDPDEAWERAESMSDNGD